MLEEQNKDPLFPLASLTFRRARLKAAGGTHRKISKHKCRGQGAVRSENHGHSGVQVETISGGPASAACRTL